MTFREIIIGIVCLLIGLLVGWLLIDDKIDIHEGPPMFSSYDSKNGVIELPALPQGGNYWVTSQLLGEGNKGVTITSPSGMAFPPHYSCTGGLASFWDLPGMNSYQITPLYDAASCATSPPPPTTPIRVPPHTLVTKSGTLSLIGPSGMPVICKVDVYTFTDASGNTSCITLVLMEH